ncbi:hypothetical protein BHE74_00018447 [Ensete ventricosum]|uniref:Uncharacterized protein n=1 Tax=Ensete ventricosum TaxID=4639 RepID=A0A426ZAG2_ENSVE|nr:hypothetical protein B296_00012436 [Ensete ventricosum]RWW73666.1 hypothetical protein BHE74_00018447 [Ensete ventricosum]
MVKGRQGERVRLYVRGTILGTRVDGMDGSGRSPTSTRTPVGPDRGGEEVAWYCGKRMAYIYKAKMKT